MLSKDGIVVVILAINRETGKLVGRPDIVTRGFVDTREFKDMLEKSRDVVAEALDHSGTAPPTGISSAPGSGTSLTGSTTTRPSGAR